MPCRAILSALSCTLPAEAVAGLAGSPADSMGGNDKRKFCAWLRALFIFLN